MKNSKSEYDYLNKQWEKKHAPVKKEWNYMDAEEQYRIKQEKRNERIILGIILLMLVASIVVTRLLKYYDVLGG